eukprot:CAMPEP_0206274574 /NCGR_PEP_ID=MMETSP0047_2-20121206/35236_1 /ASSEMBLY_ACC=CAM_ASM_000192 /TAXON_ID=195065 /ORGANISM="Chroomonas mesostigmatica_cf, Strain CCMP1168" /LENGTH=73 /DNA_ID=CAMNT_0053703815 /DNA_START=83 /DNA_END=300 /DNA_ORIENTATION=-
MRRLNIPTFLVSGGEGLPDEERDAVNLRAQLELVRAGLHVLWSDASVGLFWDVATTWLRAAPVRYDIVAPKCG